MNRCRCGAATTPHFAPRYGHVVAVLWSLIACGSSPKTEEAKLPAPPARTASEGREVRPLLIDVAAIKACDVLEGSFMEVDEPSAPQGPERGLAAKIGRLWAEECKAERAGDDVTLEIGGRGWSWANNAQKKLGAEYEVRQYLPFRFRFTIVATLDYDYARDDGVLTLWLTPKKSIDATVTPLKKPEVNEKDAWAQLLGAVSTAFTMKSVDERAKDQASVEGETQLASKLAQGATITIDMCTGQADRVITVLEEGTVPRRPYPTLDHRWEANARVRLREGGLDADGPWASPKAPLKVKVDVEEGDAVNARLFCEDDAKAIVDAYIEGRDAPKRTPLAGGEGKHLELEAPPKACPIVLLSTLRKDATASTYRYMAFVAENAAEPLAPCDNARDRPAKRTGLPAQ